MSAEFASATTYLRQLAGYVKRPIQWAFLLGLAKTCVVILQLALIAWLAQHLLVGGESLAEQEIPLIGLAGTGILRALIPRIQQHFLRHATLIASQRARWLLTQRWQQHALAGTALSAADGALQLEPVQALQGYFSRYLVQQYLVVASPLLVLVACFFLSPVVGALLLLSGPIIPAFMALVGVGAERLSQRHAVRRFALSRVFTDKLRNLTTLKLFNAADVAVKEVAEAGEDYRKASMSTLKIAFLSSAVLEFFSSVAIAGIALYVGFGLLGFIDWLGADQLTLFSGLLVLLLAPEYFAPLRQFAQSYHDRAAAVGAATLLAASPQQQPAAVGSNRCVATTCYRWRNLRVSIGGKEHPETRLTFADNQIDEGEFCVISGKSGSGKTTLLKALLGQMPFQGQLDKPFAKRNQLAYFSQRPFLLAGSLRANVNLFESHSDKAIVEAFKRVKLDRLLKRLPMGLATKLGEQGNGLSGGEQRRLALARCLLAARPVLIADEPTENLDEVSATAIRQVLQDYCAAGNTVIIATHDPDLLAMATQVIRVGD